MLYLKSYMQMLELMLVQLLKLLELKVETQKKAQYTMQITK